METVPRRYELQSILEDILETDDAGRRDSVHFQPPDGVQMHYPAIVYNREAEVTVFADNLPYRRTETYTVTVIHLDPDNRVRDLVAALPYCAHQRWYATDGLNHDVYKLSF